MSQASFRSAVIVTALMLFSMFFGAGNLIFPPQLGVEAGDNFAPAIIGFLLTSVALPVLAIIAVAISGRTLRDISARGGKVFSLAFPVLVYLSIGACYALPRTGAVSFETAIAPLTGWTSLGAVAAFNIVFFGLSLYFAWHPSKIVERLGKLLTPALLILLVLLVTVSVTKFHLAPVQPAADYASAPAATGLIQGYLTMDSLASLAFGVIVITALHSRGITDEKRTLTGTSLAGIIAGALLAIIYVGLGYIGRVLPDASSFDNGAAMLSAAAAQTMGSAGQWIFGLIVLLACLTTAVGLIAATSEFFTTLFPKVSYTSWAIIFSVFSIVLATQGLSTVLGIAAPVISVIYPPAIVLILLTLAESLLVKNRGLRWTFMLGIWVTVIYSALAIVSSVLQEGNALAHVLSNVPGQSVELGWVAPALLAIAVGLILDVTGSRQRHSNT